MGYPKPDGYVGSANDSEFEIVRTGSGGRLSQHVSDDKFMDSADRRNATGVDYFGAE